jgi:hypothetical protein
MMARVEFEGSALSGASFRFVRHNDRNETVLCPLAQERETLARLMDCAARTATRLEPVGDSVRIILQ